MATVSSEVEMRFKVDSENASKALGEIERKTNDLGKTLEIVSGKQGAYSKASNESKKAMEDQSKETDILGDMYGDLVDKLLSTASALGIYTAAIRKSIQFAKEGIAADNEEKLSIERLDAVIKATGKSTEVTAGSFVAWADGLEQLSNSDKQALIDASAILLTFQNISTDELPRILTLATDISAVFRTDVGSSVETLGRALEDPVEGITQLKRQGILISDELAVQIGSLVEQNRLYEAQQVLLDAVESKVGGVAEKMSKSEPSIWTSLSIAFGNLKQDLGGMLNMLATDIKLPDGLKWLVDFLDKPLKGLNDLDKFPKMIKEAAAVDFEGSSIEDMQAMIDFLENSDNVHIQSDEWQNYVSIIQEAIDRRTQQATATQVLDAAEQERARNLRAQEKERTSLLSYERDLSGQLADLYASTDDGRLASLKKELSYLGQRQKLDQAMLEGNNQSSAMNASLKERLGMYPAVLAYLQDQIDAFDKAEVAADTYFDKMFGKGKDAGDFVIDIPIGFDFGRTEKETLQAELQSVKSKIEQMWSTAGSSDDTAAWDENMKKLTDKYAEISGSIDDITEKENERKRAAELLDTLLTDEERKKKTLASLQEELTRLEAEGLVTAEQKEAILQKQAENTGDIARMESERKRAAELLDTLLTDEERKRNSLASLQKELTQLEADGLVTESQKLAILQKQQGQTTVVIDKQKKLQDLLDEYGSSVTSLFGSGNIGHGLASVFESMGDSIAQGESAVDGLGDAAGEFFQEITRQISSLSITAGLRILAESGLAGLPVALGLFALGGISGVASGLMGGGGGIDTSIMDSMQDELEARQKLTESLTSSADTEYELLKKQLDRNMISDDDFLKKASDINDSKNYANAITSLSSAAKAEVSSLDSELSGMNGWDKFWSGRDEEIQSQVDRIKALFDSISNVTTADELKAIQKKLEDLGVDTGSVPAYAKGGDFVTSGPQIIKVGDNPGGRERVTVTPIGNGERAGSPGTNVIININSDVYGVDDLYAKLQVAGTKLARRGIA